ncbi:hypothetical protein GSD1FS_1983 [Bifidobacterium sp. GSD1FS]|uniref:Uncharacterized protein n=2 Tax=Bifidobacterium canis TaxID=2610880 RepID=A0A7K1J7R0_9BIFI|nr:hypothetical protein [Bifidobacterium canis]
MDDMYTQLFEIAKQCIDIIKPVYPNEDLETFIDVGEPDLAVVRALDLAHDNPDLLRKFPDSVRQLTKNKDYPEIQIFANLLNSQQ